MAEPIRQSDGSFSWESGINAGCVTTIRSASTPNGLARNQNAWLGNATVRGGGITCRNGFVPLVDTLNAGLFQGGWLYDAGYSNPYLILSISGRIYKVLVDAPYTVTDLSAAFGLTNPATVEQAFFCQGEEFLVIQAGDYVGQYGSQNNPVYTFSLTNWVAPTASVSNTITLSAAYTGNIGDQVLVQGTIIHTDTPPISFGTNSFYGVYRITNIAGNVITVVLALPSVIAWAGFTISTAAPLRISEIDQITGSPTLPLFWDGVSLRRSLGITTTTPAGVQPGINEIPAATCMDYYMGRIWYAQGRTISAGDIVKGTSGTAPYSYRDSILNVTENPMCFGGDGFTLPSSAGNIRGIKHTASINNINGQGDLYIGTRKIVAKLEVPVTRNDWIAANSSNQPKMTIAVGRGGFYGDRCVVSENSDLFYRTPTVGFRSLQLAIQNFGTWGNTGIAKNMERVFPFEDRALLHLSSGISFDNRMLQTCLPYQTASGAAFQGIIPLDFDLISTLQEKLPPAWEGMLEGIAFMQLFESDFGGNGRAFAVCLSETTKTLQVWELTDDTRFDDTNESRIQWFVETPAWTWGSEMSLKKLDGLEIWIDKLFGTAEITVEWRPDADACWYFWDTQIICSARSSCENVVNPVCYPEQPYREGQRFPVMFPSPTTINCVSSNKRPANIGFQHQLRITVKGWCRIRGIVVWANKFDRQPFEGLGG